MEKSLILILIEVGELAYSAQLSPTPPIQLANEHPPILPYPCFPLEIKQTTSPFLLLALDLPPPPLFQDSVEKNIIPQVSLASVLAKYDGKTTQELAGQLKRFRCTRLPPYIILHFKRFTKNNFVEEKNPTIVNFPINGVDFSQGMYCAVFTIVSAYLANLLP